MNDKTILHHVTELVEEEHRLRADTQAPDQNAARLRHIGEQLDQCWDLLRQRRAKREFGENPEDAKVRDPKTVEGYIG
ncbi:MAG: hypothetical protein JWQ07_714 [Ramlibacter sp.]|nr:hypothetical protein [Ramlibacter sp.]